MATPDSCTLSSAEPLGTNSDNALNCNSSVLDSVVNGTVTVVSRIGKNLNSLAQIEANYIISAINGGVWDTGISFTAFNQFMVFSGTAYKVKITTTLPFVSGATPDLAFVEPVPASFVDLANNQTGTAYTLILSDNNKTIWMNNAASNTLTIPTNASVAFAVNDIIMIVMEGVGVTKIASDTGVTLNGVLDGSGDLTSQYAAVTLIKRGTNSWVAIGNMGAIT